MIKVMVFQKGGPFCLVELRYGFSFHVCTIVSMYKFIVNFDDNCSNFHNFNKWQATHKKIENKEKVKF